MMQRRDFISLFIATWMGTITFLFSRNRSKSAYQLGQNEGVNILSRQTFMLPADARDDFKVVLNFYNITQDSPAQVDCHKNQSIENQGPSLQVDVIGSFYFFIQKATACGLLNPLVLIPNWSS